MKDNNIDNDDAGDNEDGDGDDHYGDEDDDNDDTDANTVLITFWRFCFSFWCCSADYHNDYGNDSEKYGDNMLLMTIIQLMMIINDDNNDDNADK